MSGPLAYAEAEGQRAPINSLWKIYQSATLLVGTTDNLDVRGDLGRPARTCLFLCDAGRIDFQYSHNGIDFSDALSVRNGDTFDFDNIRIAAIRVTSTNATAEYRAMVI